MSLLCPGSTFGESPYYLAPEDRVHASSVKELIAKLGREARAIDVEGFRQYFARFPDGTRTCFQRIQRLPAGYDLHQVDGELRIEARHLPGAPGPLLPLLEASVASLLAGDRKVAIALSGGLDSALVLALARRLSGRSVSILTLATDLPGYCELEETLETARVLDAGSVDVVRIHAEEIPRALPDAIAACETPLYNLHPVTKLLFARAAAERGFDAIITGDGADQVFAGAEARNYLPIAGALVRSTGLTLLSPFFDEQLVAWAREHGTDPQKTALRTAANQVLPQEMAWRKKSPRLAPDFLLENYRDRQLETQLAPKLGVPLPSPGAGPEQTLWATSAILLRHWGGTF